MRHRGAMMKAAKRSHITLNAIGFNRHHNSKWYPMP
jgi:hypothetical protein